MTGTIQAIETVYKGYKFRSRLEARWAMFYDHVGCEWTYEPEPLSVSGEAYLPDFLVSYRGTQIVHEVKSRHERQRIRPPSVYLAGKMGDEHDWRGPDVATHQYHLDGSGREWLTNSKHCFLENAFAEVIGPFKVGGDHCYIPLENSAHGAESYATGSGMEGAVVKACLTSIGEADVFCAHINTPDAFGTLVEIGVAKAAAIPISLTIEEQLIDGMWIAHRGHSQDDRHDLWFPAEVADECRVVASAEEALTFHASFINKYSTKEMRRISGIGRTQAAILTFGDPLDVSQRSFISWGGGSSVSHVCYANRSAAEHVRAHRFDGR